MFETYRGGVWELVSSWHLYLGQIPKKERCKFLWVDFLMYRIIASVYKDLDKIFRLNRNHVSKMVVTEISRTHLLLETSI